MKAATRRAIADGTRFSPTRCLGCGEECGTMHAHLVHVSVHCTEKPVRPVQCPSCLAENWKRTTCAHCATDLTRGA